MKKLTIIGSCLTLLLIVCVLVWQHLRVPSDAEISHHIIGSWTTTDGRDTIRDFAQDGSYSQGHLAQFGGIWQVKDGDLILTLTNYPPGSPPRGHIIPMKIRIIQVDDNHLVCAENTTTNTWKRR